MDVFLLRRRTLYTNLNVEKKNAMFIAKTKYSR